ncbi:hypothetical protein EHE19_016870 [Ruminiclostridium herbifermentans]|uniref:Uncharacterized protein n=1 Tax=Ruminiclostridium herbifermentans TaxID=2488810 RepID=A0A4U7J7D9_9FIRM|nr:hypothetical protein [Ruminiclostridium herbifermentans]QNU66510.1 hypothetical protein EHE19_016870 [Ruminiclostridium herbifermentans]
MVKLSSKKSTIICVVMAIFLLISIINSVYLNMQNQKLKKEDVRQMYAEWYEVRRLSEVVDKYINSGGNDGKKYALFVNHICYHFGSAVSVSELKVNMHNLLTLSYDPLFSNLANVEETLNREKATELLKSMNSDLLTISKNIMEINEEEKEELLDRSSSKYNDVNARVKDLSNKYNKLVDDYFRTYTK